MSKNEAKNEKTVQGDIKVQPIKKKRVTTRIVGTSPLIQHKWGADTKAALRDKHSGKKTKKREARNPEQEGKDATYYTDSGKYGIPLTAIKKSLISAAHKDLGIEKTLVKKAIFIPCDDTDGIIEMECDEPVIKEDTVRVGTGTADLRYRPYFYVWAVTVTWEIDCELLQDSDLLTLIDRAGFGVGIGEWRPEKGGECGRFEIDRSVETVSEFVD